MNPEFWRNKRVLVTGHTGFKGSWLSLWLQQLGAEVTGYALQPPTQPSLFAEARVAEGMNSVIGNIGDYPKLLQCLQTSQPEVVIHMAAQPLVRYSYENPVETYATNVMGTVHLLEAIRHTPSVKAVVNVTTDKCYENKEWAWGYRENEPMGGYDPYSNSKGCSELVTAAYRSSFFNAVNYRKHGVALASARAGNVIGGGDWAADRLIPDMIAAFSNQECVQIRNPQATRPWQHVLEPLRGYLQLAEALFNHGSDYAEAWNFGPGEQDAKPVSYIVKQLAQLWGDGARWSVDQTQHPHEAGYLKLDISKAKARLGWQPVLNLDGALDLIVDWTRQRASGADTQALTLKQIKNYQHLTIE